MNTHHKESHIKQMFTGIANKYDLVNTCISLGRYSYWCRHFAKATLSHHQATPQNILDLCCGTASITQALLEEMSKQALPTPSIDCVDFCPEMLKLAQHKLYENSAFLRFIRANAVDLPFPDNSYDIVSLAYGIRNIPDRKKALQEIFRILRPHGTISILEVARPNTAYSPLLRLYLRFFIPLIGGLLTRQWKTYTYFGSSIYNFSHSELIEELQNTGFHSITFSSQNLGLLHTIQAKKL